MFRIAVVEDDPQDASTLKDYLALLQVVQRLIQNGATIVVIEHDLDVICNADYIIDMEPGGGIHGGRIVATGQREDTCESAESPTEKYLK